MTSCVNYFSNGESNFLSLVDLLGERAQAQPDQLAYIFLLDGETESQSLTYSELDAKARAIAAHLQSMQGERALLLYPSGLEFITAFMGCLYAGVVAVPVYPPRRNQKLSRLLNIVNDAQAIVALTTTSILADIEQRWTSDASLAQLKLITTDTIVADRQEFAPLSVTPSSLAFLQYTSGSTGTPKGVMVTHGNIIHNQQIIHQAFGHSEQSIGVGWLPLFHDMGLIGHVLQPIYVGFPSILMPPVAFLQKPIRWLKAISNYRATTSGGPNFAYDLCVKKIEEEQLANLDLSSWDLAYSGAEPIRADTLKQFGQKFANCGFNYRAFYPCYGMAETTLFATGGGKNKSPVIQRVLAGKLEQNSVVETEIYSDESRSFVGVGRPDLNTTVIIVNPESLTPCEPGQVGEIWVRGGSVTKGYWNRPKATQETFQGYLKDSGEGPFLRTGDLGFFSNGELFVTGRLKDLIIIRGRNYYPQDIELTVENSHPSLRSHGCAAFSVEREGEERVVVACEVERTHLRKLNKEEIVKEIQIAVSTEHELDVDEVVLLKTGSIPKTSSGKIQRRASKQGFLEGSLNVVGQWQKTLYQREYVAPRTPTEEIIANIFASVLGVQNVGIHDNFFELGGHSLLATQLISQLRVTFNRELPLREIFESPTIAELEPKLNQLLTTKNQLSLPLIQPRPDSEQLPLSSAQERLWFLHQLEGSSATYNIPAALRITGNLVINALDKALSEIVSRHEVLRTSFRSVNGTPTQVIHPDSTININVVDLQQHPEAEQETVLQQQVQQEATTPFDLEVAPLIRCKLWQLDTTDYVLALTMHHIVSDGWSMGILIQELSSLYQAFAAEEPSPLPELAIQYADFTLWQRQWLSEEVLETQLNYWKEALEGAPELLQLPTDRSRPHVMSYRGSTEGFSLTTELTQKLQQLSRNLGSTLFMTLQAALAILLYRYSGQFDILIGSPIANRNRHEIESLIGFFVNTLVLRTRFEDNPSFEELLRQVRETTLIGYEHQDVPFEQVVSALQPQRSLSHSPLFQVMFVLQNAPMGKLELPGVSLSQLNQQSTIAKFDLTLSMTETEIGLVGTWEYNTDLFDGSTIKRMATHFHNLLSAIVENPQLVVGELPLLSAEERHQLLVEWNDTASDYPTDKCIHQLFEEQVEKTPDAVAVVFEQEQLTYHQLNQRANQLSHHLRSMGVGPEVLVGICVERSVEMVVGLLGILKAGGAYVPVDPNYPPERLAFMVEDATVSVLLTQTNLVADLPPGPMMVCLDQPDLVAGLSTSVLALPRVRGDNLAYVMYTSGSTGRPKGVSVTHRNVVRLVKQTNFIQFSTDDVFLQLAPISFDAATLEIWGPLLNGGKLVILPPHQPSLLELGQALQRHQITTLWLTAGLFHLMVDEHLADLQGLTWLIAGGDVLSVSHIYKAVQGLPNCQVINGYGPTENTTFTCCYPVEGVQPTDRSIPIGYPIANTQVYILDDHQNPVPIGVSGELYTGGDGVARGYHNHAPLTEAKFIENPFGQGRLYKTGDLVRYLCDGKIEYLGRIDNQVKIRGFRIELGEIESVLLRHPQIQQTVVIATEDIPGNKRLIAYIVSEEESLSTKQLREFLKQKLPDYMVPSAFVTLDTLPLTPNGKVDRKSLPAPDGEITRVEEYVAPRTEIEETLTNIWQELLGKDKVSIHDNFFEIGGDSILSIQVVSRAKNSGIQITPQQLFLHQTIAELARVATTGLSINAQQGLVTGVAPLTPIQKSFFAQNKQEPHHYNQSVLLEIPNDLDPELIKTAIGKLLEHHDALRLRFSFGGSEEQQHNHRADNNVPFDLVDLSSTPEEEQGVTLSKIATDYQRSLNLEDGPIIQVVRFNLGQERSARLLIIIHHLAVDGVSWRIFLSDLATSYQQLTEEHPIQLSPKTTAFIDWAEKLNNYAQSEILLKELDYWLNQPWSNITPLPKDYGHPNSENTIGSAGYVSRELSVEETTALLGSVNQAYNTQINDILLSGLVLSLAQCSGNSTLLIDLEGHGREELFADVDLSRTVGWFTTIFPVLLQLDSLNQPAEVIKSIKEQLRAIPNRGIGYGLLRYLCQDTRVNQQLQTIPTAEISFNYLGQFDQVQSQTGWKFASLSTGLNQSENQTRDHLLDVSGLVLEGKLTMNWIYSSNVHSRGTVEKLADSYHKTLRSILEHCQLEEAFGYTPSDFPDAQLNQVELDELLAGIKTKNVSEIYPLSPMQQGMLFHSLYAPDSGVYFEQMTFKLKGNLKVDALRESWQLVVDRYSSLRTFFVWENPSTPLQVVLKQVELPWSNLDWRDLSATEQQQQLSQMLSRQRESGFQLNLAPLMKCTLIQLSDETYQLLWSYHHLLIDGWCLSIIFKEVFSFYEAKLTGKNGNLPTPRPYRDYIAWLNEQDQETASEFWRETLVGFSAPTPLVVDKHPYQNPQPHSDYQELELCLSAQVSGQLESVARQHYVTLSTLVQGAWALLLSRYSGDEDVVFGVTVSGRSASLDGLETMVGLFINTLPLRLQVSPGDKLRDWWQQIQQLMSQLQTYCYTPLVEIQGMSEVPGGIPLFESILVFENYPVDSSLLNNESLLSLEEIKSFEKTNYPLTVVAVPGEQLSIKIIYDPVRFDEDTIRRMLGHLQTIFSAIVDNPQLVVGELPLLSPEERHQLLVEWNDTASDYPKDKCIHELVEEQVEKTPDAIAVVFEQEQLTYHQLNQRANQLANYLQNLGVRPEVLVGICVERSVEMVVGLLGILKAGGAYVPLDPNYPEERLSYMLEDSGVEVLLTQQSLLESLPSHTAQVVCLDSEWPAIEQHSGDNLDVGVTSDNLADVIYTSGSTGQPKGVAIEHHSPVALCHWAKQTFTTGQLSGVLGATSICFDLSVFELFVTLCLGGRVILAQNVLDITNLDTASEITLINTVPSAIAELLRVEGIPPQVQTVNLAGEPIQNKIVQQLYQHQTIEFVYNLYGPSEDTTYSTQAKLVKGATEAPSIGRPITNTQVYILDSHLQPLPIGVPGELYIGGDGLAREYLNRPELTKEKFITNPFSSSKSQRLYKTGDLARYRSDGNIEFLGRIDNQVKIRGFRIELGEIESVLLRHPQIQQTVVIATEDIPGNKRLIAYIVSEEESLSTKQLREFLKQKLPDYMVPSAFVTLDTLPLTPNGKVDRFALPAPDAAFSQSSDFLAPKTESQILIASLFAEILSLHPESISLDDSFFDLGGHSLLATQLMFRIREAFEVNLSLRALFDYPSVSDLASAIDQALVTGDYQSQTWDLEAEAALDSDIQPSTAIAPIVSPMERIFLTGATGFLGIHLLSELLTTTTATVYCLVRADNRDAGKERLLNKLEATGLWSDNFTSRIIPIIGDLGTSRFGLSATEYNNLCQDIDVVYHVGAKVHHLWSYALLKDANVLGTQDVLRLASLGKLKPVHYVSTLFSTSQTDQPILESATANHYDLPKLGYVQSKWVAEQLVWEAAKRGLPITIYRPSRISGHSQTGVSSFDDLLSRLVKGCILLKGFPSWSGLAENLVPVDYVSRAIVCLSQQNRLFGKAFHLINPKSVPLREIFHWVRSLGYSLEEIDYTHWRSKLIEDMENPLYPYLPNFPESPSTTTNLIEYDCRNVVDGLSGSGIKLPEVNQDLFKTYLCYFRESGFLED